MQDTYDLLLELGVQDEDIMAEAFGPASIKRIAKKQPTTDSAEQAEVAETAVIQFAKSQVEQPWQKVDGNLLDFAESHGLEPEFGCRGGSCGSCKVKGTTGEVVHSENAMFPVAEGEALLCCAMPKKTGVGDIETVIVEV
jgi:ferredoxin